MTDQEFKRLGRAQLIEVIYQLQLEVDTLTEQKKKLETALADKRLRIDSAGSIAEAALDINNCFASAQKAADQYLREIKLIREETELEQRRILGEAQEEANRLIAEAQAEAAEILTDAERTKKDYNRAVDAIMEEYGLGESHNGDRV